jgi:hypothetical protein
MPVEFEQPPTAENPSRQAAKSPHRDGKETNRDAKRTGCMKDLSRMIPKSQPRCGATGAKVWWRLRLNWRGFSSLGQAKDYISIE